MCCAFARYILENVLVLVVYKRYRCIYLLFEGKLAPLLASLLGIFGRQKGRLWL